MVLIHSIWLVGLLACGGKEEGRWPVNPKSGFEAIPAERADETAGAALQANEKILARITRGPFGPTDDTALIIVSSPSGFAGFGLVGGTERIDLPAFPDTGFAVNVLDVTHADVDGDGHQEAIVLTTYMKGASDTTERHVNVVFDWDGKQFNRLLAVEETLTGASSAKEAKSMLGG